MSFDPNDDEWPDFQPKKTGSSPDPLLNLFGQSQSRELEPIDDDEDDDVPSGKSAEPESSPSVGVRMVEENPPRESVSPASRRPDRDNSRKPEAKAQEKEPSHRSRPAPSAAGQSVTKADSKPESKPESKAPARSHWSRLAGMLGIGGRPGKQIDEDETADDPETPSASDRATDRDRDSLAANQPDAVREHSMDAAEPEYQADEDVGFDSEPADGEPMDDSRFHPGDDTGPHGEDADFVEFEIEELDPEGRVTLSQGAVDRDDFPGDEPARESGASRGAASETASGRKPRHRGRRSSGRPRDGEASPAESGTVNKESRGESRNESRSAPKTTDRPERDRESVKSGEAAREPRRGSGRPAEGDRGRNSRRTTERGARPARPESASRSPHDPAEIHDPSGSRRLRDLEVDSDPVDPLDSGEFEGPVAESVPRKLSSDGAPGEGELPKRKRRRRGGRGRSRTAEGEVVGGEESPTEEAARPTARGRSGRDNFADEDDDDDIDSDADNSARGRNRDDKSRKVVTTWAEAIEGMISRNIAAHNSDSGGRGRNGPNRGGQNRGGQSRGGPNRGGPNRSGPNRSGRGNRQG